MCEVISSEKRGKGRLHVSETFPTFFFEQEYGLLLLLIFFWREKDEWHQLMDTAEKRAIN